MFFKRFLERCYGFARSYVWREGIPKYNCLYRKRFCVSMCFMNSYINKTNKITTPLPSRLVTVGDINQSLPALIKENTNKTKTLKIKENTKLYICTLNCLTLRTQERLTELELALSKIKWDIIGLSEVRRLGESIEDRKEYVLYYKGETKGSYGVGFMIKKRLEKNIEEFIGISERIAVLNMHLPGYKYKWSIIQVYAPTE